MASSPGVLTHVDVEGRQTPNTLTTLLGVTALWSPAAFMGQTGQGPYCKLWGLVIGWSYH